MHNGTTRAVLFDFGGTLYDYAVLANAERDSLLALARWAGADADVMAVAVAHRNALRRVFNEYLQRRFYLHRDLFRDAVLGMLQELGAPLPLDEPLRRYRDLQWKRHAEDFSLREGVEDTLRGLRRKGLHVGMVSNIDDDQLQHLLAVSGVEPYFDSILSSEQAGSCKPDRAIFEEALQRAGCRPQEALFVGDTLRQDIAGANDAGMRSVLLWHREDRDPPDGDPRPAHVIRRIPDLLAIVGG
jgi:HAD superfamily hydrolase (TIGR01509 family)